MNKLLQHRKERDERLRVKALKEGGDSTLASNPVKSSKLSKYDKSANKKKAVKKDDGKDQEEVVDNNDEVEEENITVEGTEDSVSKLVGQWMSDALNLGDGDDDDDNDNDNSNSSALSSRAIEEYTNDAKEDAIEDEERIAGVGLGAERKPKNVTKAQERLEEKLKRDKASSKRASKEAGGALAAPAVFDSGDSRSSVLGKRLRKKGNDSMTKVDKLLKRDRLKKKEEKKEKKEKKKAAAKAQQQQQQQQPSPTPSPSVEKKEEENEKKEEDEMKVEGKNGDVVSNEGNEGEKKDESNQSKPLPDYIGIKRERNFGKGGFNNKGNGKEGGFDSPLKKKKRKTRSKQKNIKKDHRPPELRPGGRPQPQPQQQQEQQEPTNEGENSDKN